MGLGAFPTATAKLPNTQPHETIKPDTALSETDRLIHLRRSAWPDQNKSRATGVSPRCHSVFMLTLEVPASVEQGQPAHTLAFIPPINSSRRQFPFLPSSKSPTIDFHGQRGIKKKKKKAKHTKFNNRQTESLGCAPTPSQYFARDRSSEISLYALARAASSSDRFVGRCGTGFSVPITSRGFELRADLFTTGRVSDCSILPYQA